MLIKTTPFRDRIADWTAKKTPYSDQTAKCITNKIRCGDQLPTGPPTQLKVLTILLTG
jgi:hypothetical protein